MDADRTQADRPDADGRAADRGADRTLARLRELGFALPAPLAPPPGVRLPFALVRVAGERAGHARAGAHGHGALGDDHALAVDRAPHLLGGGEHVREVGRAVLAGGGADRQEHHGGAGHRLGGGNAEPGRHAGPLVDRRRLPQRPGEPGQRLQQVVADLGAAASAGLLGAGMLPAPKHFPGHGSVTDDSHVTAPVQDAAVADLDQRDWLPFRELVSGGQYTPMVMMGHVIVPELEPDVPSSVSAPAYEALRGLGASPDGTGARS